MDAMALLCNMHADGPATLRLLRRAGMKSLSDVEERPPEKLADLLGVSPAFARRFAREARMLAERMGVAPLDPEEGEMIEPASALPHARLEAQPLRMEAPESSPRSIARGFAPSAERVLPSETQLETAREMSIFRRSGRPAARPPEYRERSPYESVESYPSVEPVENRPSGAMRSRSSSLTREEPRSWEPSHPREPHPARARILTSPGRTLRPGQIEGLDAALCDKLVAQGVITLEALVDSPGLKLAKRLEIPFTRLCDLQMLAKKFLSENGRSMPNEAQEIPDREPIGNAPLKETDYEIRPPHRSPSRTLWSSEPPESAGATSPRTSALPGRSFPSETAGESAGRYSSGAPPGSLGRSQRVSRDEDVAGPFA